MGMYFYFILFYKRTPNIWT